ncbi:unnamed protein product [Parnassius apollo]|uniref:(apollo) hypothetical protein n=1 Tax=Parnassius apollo TaxID=110799 RepID=A0A8S3WGV1_PARAO|nr:unnamed protein product [Parnassius apollo]
MRGRCGSVRKCEAEGGEGDARGVLGARELRGEPGAQGELGAQGAKCVPTGRTRRVPPSPRRHPHVHTRYCSHVPFDARDALMTATPSTNMTTPDNNHRFKIKNTQSCLDWD